MIPRRHIFPKPVSRASEPEPLHGVANSLRQYQRSSRYVRRMETAEGMLNIASHRTKGGIAELNTTRFAGFEIGSTKLAAFATNAHEKR
jgi:hypothetical protein